MWGVKPAQIVEVTPEVTSWVHYMQEVAARAKDYHGKSVILGASQQEQRSPIFIMLGTEYQVQ